MIVALDDPLSRGLAVSFSAKWIWELPSTGGRRRPRDQGKLPCRCAAPEIVLHSPAKVCGVLDEQPNEPIEQDDYTENIGFFGGMSWKTS